MDLDHFAYFLAEQQIADQSRHTRPRHAPSARPAGVTRRRAARGLRRLARALDAED